jgi:hypothetical protein
VSITHLIFGIVTEASAIFVASTILRVSGGASFHTCNCFAAGRPANSGQTLIHGPGASCNFQNISFNLVSTSTNVKQPASSESSATYFCYVLDIVHNRFNFFLSS